jgi:hypothetical protein
MFDLTANPQKQTIIYPNGEAMQTWQKPSGATFVYMFAVGGGGGGGGGQTDAAGTNRGGGGGGALGAYWTAMFSAFLVPNTLYIQVGLGGAGGPAQTNGSDGTPTYILASPVAEQKRALLFTGYGGGGVGATGSSGGTGGAITGTTNSLFSSQGITINQSGLVGTNGGSSSGGGTSHTPSGNIFTPGCGGAGTDTANTNRAGANINSVGIYTLISGGTLTVADGQGSFMLWKPFWSPGGAGGASRGTTAGGNGGNASFGSGGGGGGAGTTGGTGGKGGNGLVIFSWI